jgi:hypothetical protein
MKLKSDVLGTWSKYHQGRCMICLSPESPGWTLCDVHRRQWKEAGEPSDPDAWMESHPDFWQRLDQAKRLN